MIVHAPRQRTVDLPLWEWASNRIGEVVVATALHFAVDPVERLGTRQSPFDSSRRGALSVLRLVVGERVRDREVPIEFEDGLGGDGPTAVLHNLARVCELLGAQASNEPAISSLLDLSNDATVALEEMHAGLRQLASGLETDPEALAEVEATLGTAHDLARKHRTRLDA